MIRRRVEVAGRVQGVFFRDSVARLARERGVAGWVTNRNDGSVEAVFEGEEADVGALVSFCREGPERAVVADVTVHEEEPARLDGFAVR